MENRLREIRQLKRLSQFGLAKLSNVEPSILSKIETGIISPYPAWRKRIAEALGVLEAEIFPEVTEDGK